ncbi:MAG TPA: hypothetical protein PKD26_16820 [Pyrinomonadaceae bacterium]|nr:hypothetical protein [Pyrinomonadaceae bacterium]
MSTTDVFGKVIDYKYERTPTVNQKRLKFDGSMHAVYNFDDAGRLTNIGDPSFDMIGSKREPRRMPAGERGHPPLLRKEGS